MNPKLYFVKFSYTAVVAAESDPDIGTIAAIEEDVLCEIEPTVELVTEIENMDQLQRLAPDIDPDEEPYGYQTHDVKTIRDYLEPQ